MKRPKISYENMPAYLPTFDTLFNGVKKITSLDVDDMFAFTVRFGGKPYNDFTVTVYHREHTEATKAPIAVLNRGGELEMAKIVKEWSVKQKK